MNIILNLNQFGKYLNGPFLSICRLNQVMLLSLLAGGIGLNLIGANHLILIEPHWNPQLEIQAEDRVFRMGQEKTVWIYR